ncbi:MAG TPA: peptidylprolyl isomerase, partial [Ignavibacteriaceae bacterium]|nr:peptidylprolyl isomerase [Ignavibacteriaceae bacterium]
IYKAYGNTTTDSSAMNYLLENYNAEVEKNKIHILSSLLNFQKSFSDSEKLKEFLMKELSSESASLISITADGIDSNFISNNSNSLKKIIADQISKHKNNPDFIESVISLTNLSERIDKKFYEDITLEVESSDLYSIKKFISNKPGKKFNEPKESPLFDRFWENAFKYKTAEVITERGKFKIKFLPQYAPISVGNFCYLASKNFFNGIEFHRVVPGFVIQAGDPTGTGWGGPGYEIVSEFSPLSFNTGYVGMASAGKDTEGSQWFVMQGNYPHLNGRYSVFGRIVDGLETVYYTDQEDKIISIKLIE